MDASIEGSASAQTGCESTIAVRGSVSKETPLTCLEQVDEFLNGSIGWSVFVCILTVWALFSDDIRLLCLPKSVDLPMLIVTLVILGIFLIEFALCWIAQSGYAFSLGSLMDLLAALSLIPFDEILSEIDGVSDSISVARVARAARALRILRATRAAAMALKTESRVRRVSNKLKNIETSVLADTLINSTNIKMLLGILVLLMGTTLLDIAISDTSADAGLEILDRVYGQQYLPSPAARNAVAAWDTVFNKYKSTVEGSDGDTLLRLKKLEVWGVTYLSHSTSDIRKKDLLKFKVGNSTWSSRSVAQVSTEGITERRAIFSIIMTIFSVLVIVIWAWSFRNDYNSLVITPVNRMIDVLKDMALDPRRSVMEGADRRCAAGKSTEMDAIENCIGKFGELLKVGFGEAGMGIIARNLGDQNKHFDPVVPGVVVKAVFGFCDIRNFTDCCEVLNEDTMIFTNKIAHIVHGLVESSGGSVNKNIGDAFLSVWKLKEDDAPAPVSDAQNENVTPRASASSGGESRPVSKRSLSHHLTGSYDTCDESLHAFLKMNDLLRNSAAIQELSADPRLQKKLPGYTVRMGSGLHLGWAIEGAVGTPHKVDATYLSPHVNMAARLEAATKQYGVAILMSDALVDNFGMKLRAECRAIDRVTVKGSAEPLTLYVHMPSEARELNDTQRGQFMSIWESAFNKYQTGSDWSDASKLMRKCLDILPRDKPAAVLLTVMEQAGGKAPADWPGYRELTSK